MIIDNIKYYPDRFYICLDGFNANNLTTFLHDLDIKQNQAVFIHEYYHYLTNLTTFPGVRQFHLNFCDRFRLVTRLAYNNGLEAFPINSNKFAGSAEEVAEWFRIKEILDSDDINRDLVLETEQTSAKSFEIIDIIRDEQIVNGRRRQLIKLRISGLIRTSETFLTFGVMDEFFSSSIDEFLFQNSFSDIDPSFLSQRPFYPYRLFDKLLSHYGIDRPSAFEKILIIYTALNSFNPPVKLIELLEKIKTETSVFHEAPDAYVLKEFSESGQYNNLLALILSFSDETSSQGRLHISQALKYYYDKFYSALKFKEQDPFYFIRPFFYTEKQSFLNAFSRIVNQFTPPVILQDKAFKTVDKLTNFGELTAMIIATYEIFESLKNDKIAKRPDYYKARYTFPSEDNDFSKLPIKGTFLLAMNELSLFKLYADSQKN